MFFGEIFGGWWILNSAVVLAFVAGKSQILKCTTTSDATAYCYYSDDDREVCCRSLVLITAVDFFFLLEF